MSREPWQLYFSAACEPDPGGAMFCGYAIVRIDTGEMETAGKAFPRPVTSNTRALAEYCALYLGLARVRDMIAGMGVDARPIGTHPRYTGLRVESDASILTAIADRRKVEAPEREAAAHAKCIELLAGPLAPFEVRPISEEWNKLANDLVVRAAAENLVRVAAREVVV